MKQQELQAVNEQPAPPRPVGLPVSAERAWLHAHAEQLRTRLEALARIEARPGRGGAKKREAAAMLADKLERRLSRLLRDASRLDARVVVEEKRARAMVRSKDPRHRAEVILRALDELPAELAAQVAAEGAQRAAARLGRGQEGGEL